YHNDSPLADVASARSPLAMRPSPPAGFRSAPTRWALRVDAAFTTFVARGGDPGLDAPARPWAEARPGLLAPAVHGALALLLVAPPLLGRDASSYNANGELIARGLDPNHNSPAALGDSDLYDAVHPAWRHTRSPYGPLALRIGAVAVALAGHRMNASVIAMR